MWLRLSRELDSAVSVPHSSLLKLNPIPLPQLIITFLVILLKARSRSDPPVENGRSVDEHLSFPTRGEIKILELKNIAGVK